MAVITFDLPRTAIAWFAERTRHATLVLIGRPSALGNLKTASVHFPLQRNKPAARRIMSACTWVPVFIRNRDRTAVRQTRGLGYADADVRSAESVNRWFASCVEALDITVPFSQDPGQTSLGSLEFRHRTGSAYNSAPTYREVPRSAMYTFEVGWTSDSLTVFCFTGNDTLSISQFARPICPFLDQDSYASRPPLNFQELVWAFDPSTFVQQKLLRSLSRKSPYEYTYGSPWYDTAQPKPDIVSFSTHGPNEAIAHVLSTGKTCPGVSFGPRFIGNHFVLSFSVLLVKFLQRVTPIPCAASSRKIRRRVAPAHNGISIEKGPFYTAFFSSPRYAALVQTLTLLRSQDDLTRGERLSSNPRWTDWERQNRSDTLGADLIETPRPLSRNYPANTGGGCELGANSVLVDLARVQGSEALKPGNGVPLVPGSLYATSPRRLGACGRTANNSQGLEEEGRGRRNRMSRQRCARSSVPGFLHPRDVRAAFKESRGDNRVAGAELHSSEEACGG
ncbi:hypothetical protein DFH06DRAFT_1149253 [Mycena polygramma]|nr:hypothetical protein DFH06DRAFT_1149253 [Mycena polygramma]